MTTNRMGFASDSDIQQIIDSTEKGTTMFVAVHAFYLMAKELKALREASKVPDGWQLVPIEPTYEMSKAIGLPWGFPPFPLRWKRILEAAPKAGTHG